MIDPDKLERDVAAVEGDFVAVSKSQFGEIITDLRSGGRARIDLARHLAFASVCDRIAGGVSA